MLQNWHSHAIHADGTITPAGTCAAHFLTTALELAANELKRNKKKLQLRPRIIVIFSIAREPCHVTVTHAEQ